VCLACERPVEKTTPNGFKFTVVKSGDGILPKPQQCVVFDFTVKDSNDSTWSSSYEQGIPIIVPIGDTSRIHEETGMFQMFRMMSAADSITITQPVNAFFRDVYGAFPPPGIDSTMTMTCNVKVKAVIEMHQQRDYMEKLLAKRKPAQKAKDLKKIDDYLAKNNITAQQDTSGIRYVVHKSAGGEKPAAGNCVQVAYHGKFLENGRTFDKNDDVSFSLAGVIPGWQYGIPLLGVGDSATLYIPSHLCYGPEGIRGAIPPDAILIFDVKILGKGANLDPNTRACIDGDPVLLQAPEEKKPAAKKKASK
jgi:FKBP-type peptidyl-prolyl cis-trans isomerase